MGRSGNSGASSGPHTHVHLKPCGTCDAIPFQFENARRQEVSMDPQASADPAKWVQLKGALLPEQDPGQKREIIKPDLAPPQKQGGRGGVVFPASPGERPADWRASRFQAACEGLSAMRQRNLAPQLC